MPEMRITARTVDLGTDHAMGPIGLGGDRLGGHSVPEAGPASAGIELGV